MPAPRATALALLLALALGATACGAEDPDQRGQRRGQSDAAGAPVPPGARSGAADLRARLTAHLSDHAHLLGLALNAGLADGLSSSDFKAAAGALDANTVDLANIVAASYGRETGERFLELWRKLVSLQVQDAKARATGDDAARRTTAGALDRTRREVGKALATGNPGLPAEATAEELEPLADGLQSYTDALVAESPTAYARLRAAAANAPMTAKVLATGIAGQLPDRFDGSAATGAAELRGTLTGLLGSHAHLTGVLAAAGAATDFQGGAFQAAEVAVDSATTALAKAVRNAWGPDAERGFLERWRTQDEALLRYALAQVNSDRAEAKAALEQLDAFRTDLGAFLASISPQLPAGVVAEALKSPIAAQTAAIRAAVKGSRRSFDRLREAAQETTGLAALLADGIARQFPERYPPA